MTRRTATGPRKRSGPRTERRSSLFPSLVLGCINSDFHNQRRILQNLIYKTIWLNFQNLAKSNLEKKKNQRLYATESLGFGNA